MENQDFIDKATSGISPNWSGDRRLRFVDFRLQWEGRLNRADIVKFFDISVPQASKDIAAYMKANPNNIEYDKSSKNYIAPATFKATYPNTTGAKQYLGQILAIEHGALSEDQATLGFRPPTSSVPVPEREIDEPQLKSLIQAIRECQMLEVDYQSITRDEPTRRMISPHALGYDGVRWHVRAYCHLRNAFHDFVIGRITKVGHAKSTLIRALDDQDWHEKVDLVLAPHPALSTQQKRGVEIDYKMIDGRTKLTSRRAMLYYTLRRLGIRDDGTPQDYPKQVVIENLEEVRPFLQFDLSRRK